jgi:hypothetical protein
MPIDPRRTVHIQQRWSHRPRTITTAPNGVPLATEPQPYTARIIVADSHRTECARG